MNIGKVDDIDETRHLKSMLDDEKFWDKARLSYKIFEMQVMNKKLKESGFKGSFIPLELIDIAKELEELEGKDENGKSSNK